MAQGVNWGEPIALFHAWGREKMAASWFLDGDGAATPGGVGSILPFTLAAS